MADPGALSAKLTLETDDGKVDFEPTAAGIAEALARRPSGDWYLNLARGEDDYMEATNDEASLWVDCEEGGVYRKTASYVDEEAARSMLVSFLEGGSGWLDLARWVDPSKEAEKKKSRKKPLGTAVPAVAAAAAGFFLAGIYIAGAGAALPVAFALAFPGLIAFAAATKLQEVKRVAAWTKGSARVISAEVTSKTKNGKEVLVPRIEYEFTVAFHRYRGRRVSLGEIVGKDEAEAMMKRYRPGVTVPVYYDPDDPDNESVLERDLPQHFHMIWVFAAVLALLVLGGAYWFSR